jgi:MOSC domain-containing protein YiiM
MARVVAVHRSTTHSFSKFPEDRLDLVAGLGVQGDAHAGVTVKHRSRVKKDPAAPNLRQVHLIHCELLRDLERRGFTVWPGDLGENITTEGIDLLAVPTGTQLAIGPQAVLEVTGLRNPCVQIDRFQSGLMDAVLDRAADGALIRKAGVMAIVIASGAISAGDAIEVRLPVAPHQPLVPV